LFKLIFWRLTTENRTSTEERKKLKAFHFNFSFKLNWL